MTRPRIGDVAALAAFFSAVAIDVAVLTKADDSITASCRRHPAVTGLIAAAFLGHLTNRPKRLAKADPFRAVGAIATIVGSRTHR